ncbi:hypothetical protein PV325_010906, partial [Microctonus aethiopoides]
MSNNGKSGEEAGGDGAPSVYVAPSENGAPLGAVNGVESEAGAPVNWREIVESLRRTVEGQVTVFDRLLQLQQPQQQQRQQQQQQRRQQQQQQQPQRRGSRRRGVGGGGASRAR